MSEPKVLYVQRPVPGGVWDFQPADDSEVLAHIRSRVESGTIEGEVADTWEIDDPGGLWVPVNEPGTYIVIGPVSDGGSET